MKSNFRLAALLFQIVALPASAAVHYVNVSSPTPVPPYADWSTAANTIQEAINTATNGDVILVTNGVYAEGGMIVNGSLSNRVAATFPLTLRSVNGPLVTSILGYRNLTNNTGDDAVRCAYLTNGSAITGFTFTNGATRNAGDPDTEQSGGGLWCGTNDVTVSNCVFAVNAATFGGGVVRGKLFNCMLTGNTSGNGGGADASTLTSCTVSNNNAGVGAGGYGCTFEDCLIVSNSTGGVGGGAFGSTLNGSVLMDNYAYQAGGGADQSTVNNCKFIGNWSNDGGGADFCNVNNSSFTGNTGGYGAGSLGCTLNNCTLTGNFGVGVLDSDARNCISYYNFDSNWLLDGEIPGSFNYCCTTPLPDSGTGNFTSEPQLATTSHISANSPCRGAGSIAYTNGVDIDGEAWLNPPSVGCDEYYPGTATGPLTVAFTTDFTNASAGYTVRLTGDIEGLADASRWEFGDGTILSNRPYATHAWSSAGDYAVVLRAYNASFPAGVTATQIVHISSGIYYVVTNNPSSTAPYDSWAKAATNIQDAVDAAFVGGTVLVSNGVYRAGGHVVYLSQTNRVAIDKTLTVRSVNGPAATIIEGALDSFTTMGTNAIRGVYMTNSTTLSGFTVTNGATWLIQCECYDDGVYRGGGIWCESATATITNCIVTGCYASDLGGGISGGTSWNCLIASNHADLAISGYGGGAESATLNNCELSGNSSFAIGGGAVYSALNNCLLHGNSTAGNGGGAGSSTLNNCTLVENSAQANGGGNAYSMLSNCISYYNSCASGPNTYADTMDHCCTTPDQGGYGDITNEPAFSSLALGNFRLSANSPCINSGNNVNAPGGPDLDGNPRVKGGTVDIGAYEFQTPTSVISYAWLQRYGFPTGGSADYADPDGDHMNNWQEWRAGTDPTNAASFLQLLNPSQGSTGVSITWQSGAGVIYFLERSTNLTIAPFPIIQSNIIGSAVTTTYTDTTADTNAGPYYYRVGVQ